MTILHLSTFDARYERSAGGRIALVSTLFSGVGNDLIPRETVECKTLADVRAAVAAYGAKAAAALPGVSFYVSVIPAKGSRKLPGFDAAHDSGDRLGTRAWILTVERV